MPPPPLLQDAAAFVWKHRRKIIDGLAILAAFVEAVDATPPEKPARARVVKTKCLRHQKTQPRRKRR